MKFEHSYICFDCAEGKGLSWPDKHEATVHMGMCEYCKKEVPLTSVTDWMRPGQGHKGPLVWD